MTVYRWEISGIKPIEKTGIVYANSPTHAKRLARKASGQTWAKQWRTGFHGMAIDGTQAWIGDNDHEPHQILWVYQPR